MACLSAEPGSADQRLEDFKRSFMECRSIAETEPRVACYDALTATLAPPTYAGRLGFQTEPFTIQRPTTIRYESEGVIFVMYLKDQQDQVVQNLHLGGGGAASYLIEKPGTYSLQINGAEGWRVWLDPQP